MIADTPFPLSADNMMHMTIHPNPVDSSTKFVTSSNYIPLFALLTHGSLIISYLKQPKEKLSAKAEVKRYRAMMVEEPYSMVGLDLVGPFQADVTYLGNLYFSHQRK